MLSVNLECIVRGDWSIGDHPESDGNKYLVFAGIVVLLVSILLAPSRIVVSSDAAASIVVATRSEESWVVVCELYGKVSE